MGVGPSVAHGAKTLGTRQTAFDAEMAAIEEVLKWFGTSPYLHMIIHSDSTSAISRAGQSGTGPGQQRARKIQKMVAHLLRHYQSTEITWVKAHAGTPGNKRADALAGAAAEKESWSPFTSLAHLKLRISKKFQESKIEWDGDPHHHGTEEIPPPHPKSHAWTRLEMPSPERPPRSGPATGDPRCTFVAACTQGRRPVSFVFCLL
jgi:ribonuclease HI